MMKQYKFWKKKKNRNIIKRSVNFYIYNHPIRFIKTKKRARSRKIKKPKKIALYYNFKITMIIIKLFIEKKII